MSLRQFLSSVSIWIHSVFVFGVVMLVLWGLIQVIGPKTDNLTATASGIVSRVDMKKGKGGRSYVTFVRFEDSDHRTYVTQSANADHDSRHFVGQEVVVHYNPYMPGERVLIEGDEDLLGSWNLFASILLYGGIAAVIVSALLAAREWYLTQNQ